VAAAAVSYRTVCNNNEYIHYILLIIILFHLLSYSRIQASVARKAVMSRYEEAEKENRGAGLGKASLRSLSRSPLSRSALTRSGEDAAGPAPAERQLARLQVRGGLPFRKM
jgi:hypothetical protein